jgi:signal transduction histidine kinase
MNKDLILRLFVHDIKAPLAVIDLGARSLLRMSEDHDLWSSQQKELLLTIIEARNRAVTVLNRILGEKPDGSIRQPDSKTGRARGFLQHLSKWRALVSNDRARSHRLVSRGPVLDELRKILVYLTKKVTLLQQNIRSQRNMRIKAGKTARRMLRNAKLALHLTDNAVHLLVQGDETVKFTGCKVSELVRRALIEVFDVMETDISEELHSCTSLLEMKAVLIQDGVYLCVDDGLWETTIHLDCGKVNQVIVNLMLNAMKYRRSRIDLSATKSDGRMAIVVRDDGEGIPAAGRERIFDDTMRADKQGDFPIRGHGIGLAGSQALLQAMNGRLLCESDGHTYTRFSAEIDCGLQG